MELIAELSQKEIPMDSLLMEEAVSEKLQVSLACLRRWRLQGEGPKYVKMGGVESGGAVADMGRYCAYLDADGNPAPWLQQIDSISGNGRHAIVIAPELVRIEMLRIGHTYELAITRLWLKSEEGHTRPAIVTAPLFRGHQGTLAVELWNA
ncbi:MAG: hypothetical protein WCA21_04890, partial [Terracidiphilus sp.]